jgi:hypothetical protein
VFTTLFKKQLRRLTTPLLGFFSQAFIKQVCFASLDPAVTSFSIKPFLKRFALKRADFWAR